MEPRRASSSLYSHWDYRLVPACPTDMVLGIIPRTSRMLGKQSTCCATPKVLTPRVSSSTPEMSTRSRIRKWTNHPQHFDPCLFLHRSYRLCLLPPDSPQIVTVVPQLPKDSSHSPYIPGEWLRESEEPSLDAGSGLSTPHPGREAACPLGLLLMPAGERGC